MLFNFESATDGHVVVDVDASQNVSLIQMQQNEVLSWLRSNLGAGQLGRSWEQLKSIHMIETNFLAPLNGVMYYVAYTMRMVMNQLGRSLYQVGISNLEDF